MTFISVCLNCKKKFEWKQNDRFHTRVYCSVKCRQEYLHKHSEISI